MRISTTADDRAYNPDARSIVRDVLLDGVAIQDCLTADEEAGEVIVFVREADGRRLKFTEGGDEILTEVRHGRVQIVLR